MDDMAGRPGAHSLRPWRRRKAILFMVTLASVGIAAVGGAVLVRSFIDAQDQSRVPAAVRSGPLTGEECPSGINGATEPFFGDDDEAATAGSPVEQAKRLGEQLVTPSHPEALLMPGVRSDKLEEYVYVLPSGDRVARISFTPTSDGTWRFYGMEHC